MTTSQPIGINAESIYALPPEERYHQLLGSFGIGLQSSLFAEARRILRDAFTQKLKEVADEKDGGSRKSKTRTSIVVAYTSNLISCGLRETFASMARLQVADAFISTAGGVEEDVIKCLGDTLVGDFALKGADLRLQGLNRVGNLLIPNDNYIDFETFFVPVVKKLHQLQLESDWETCTSPSELIRLMGQTLNDKSSDQYLQSAALTADEEEAIKKDVAASNLNGESDEEIQKLVAARIQVLGFEKTRINSLVCNCARNNIPIYCPALTDGSMGDMICFYSYNKKGFVCDPCVDYRCLVDIEGLSNADEGIEEHNLLVLALGAGLPRNHALHLTPHTGTYASDSGKQIKVKRTVVQVVTGLDIDGCNSGAQLQDDLAEGLIGADDRVVRVHGDASLLLPMMLGGITTA